VAEANDVRGLKFSELLPLSIGPADLAGALEHVGNHPYAAVFLSAMRRAGVADPRPTITMFFDTERGAWRVTALCAKDGD